MSRGIHRICCCQPLYSLSSTAFVITREWTAAWLSWKSHDKIAEYIPGTDPPVFLQWVYEPSANPEPTPDWQTVIDACWQKWLNGEIYYETYLPGNIGERIEATEYREGEYTTRHFLMERTAIQSYFDTSPAALDYDPATEQLTDVTLVIGVTPYEFNTRGSLYWKAMHKDTPMMDGTTDTTIVDIETGTAVVATAPDAFPMLLETAYQRVTAAVTENEVRGSADEWYMACAPRHVKPTLDDQGLFFASILDAPHITYKVRPKP